MSQEDWGVDDPENQYYYNTKTHSVEQGAQSNAMDRIGPFKTRDEAERALEIVRERSKKWAEEEADD